MCAVPSVWPMRSTPTTAVPASSRSTPSTITSNGSVTTAATLVASTKKGLTMVLNPVHADMLRKKRHLNPDLAMRLGVHSESNASGSAVLFEYRLEGQVHNVKRRLGNGNMPWAQSGKPLILWNIDSLADPPAPDEPLVITEGEFDALAVLQTGTFSRVVSVPNGAPGRANEEGGKRYGYLFDGQGNLLTDIAKFETVILATDGDRSEERRVGKECRSWWT